MRLTGNHPSGPFAFHPPTVGTNSGNHEMTLESIGGIFAAFAAVGSMIFGGGLLTRHIKQSNELAVTRYIALETEKRLVGVINDVAALKIESAGAHAKIDQFADNIKKLDLIPRLDERLEAMSKLIESVQQMVSHIRAK
jgi:hypothetical protein